jgi:hypothetical protein
MLLSLLEQAAALCVIESFDRGCIADHLRRLDGPKKTSYLGFLAAKTADNPGMQENLCAMIKEGSP